MYKVFDIENLTDFLYNKYFSMMSKSRKEKVEQLKNEDARKRTVAGEMLVKQMIAEKVNISEEDVVIEIGDKGKPFSNYMHFSISHCDNLVICAVSENPIGADIEKIMPYNDKLAKRITNDAEYEYIENKGEKLCEIWTLKEAVIKRDGKGISAMKSINALTEKNKLSGKLGDYLIHIVF